MLPDADTDPPEPSLVDAGTPEDLLRELFGRYTARLKAHLGQGELSPSDLGRWFREQNDYESLLSVAALGKDNQVTKIMQALGFRVQGSGVKARFRNPP